MAINVRIFNGKKEPIEATAKEGFVYKDQLNETRDAAVAVIRSKGGHLDVQPFDYAEIEGEAAGKPIEKKALVVDGYTEEQTCFGEREDFDVSISLFSQTKELERVALPNLAITALADGTRRSVYEYIKRYVDQYAPKIKVAAVGGGFYYAPCWEIDPAVEDRFSSVDVPEMSWNAPTLCETITDLMQVDGCIPTIKGNVLSFVDLRARGSEIDASKVVSARWQMSSADYNQNLVVPMKNAIGRNPTRASEWVSMRNQSEGVITTANMQILTQKPIYAVRKAVAILHVDANGTASGTHYDKFLKVDMTPSIKEKSAYDALLPDPVDFSAADFPSSVSTHQISNVHFTRGGYAIEGWGKEWDFGLSRVKTSIEILMRQWFDQQKSANDEDFSVLDFRDVMFYIEYDTIGEATVSAGKALPLRNQLTASFDGQGSSYVDVDRQSLVEYSKADRLANKVVEIDAVYKDEKDVPKLGDTFKGAVIFSREIQYLEEAILFHGTATENYVLMNYFAGVRAKRRSWAIASGNEALTRMENSKIHAEFSFRKKDDEIVGKIYSAMDQDGASELMKALVSPFYECHNDERVKFAAFRTNLGGGKFLPEGSGTRFVADCSAEKAGMSIAFTFAMSDNYTAGVSAKYSDGRFLNSIVPYADKFGEFQRVDVDFLTFYDPADGEFTWPSVFVYPSGIVEEKFANLAVGKGITALNAMTQKARQRPISSSISTSASCFRLTEGIKKDNREVFGMTAQIEFCSDDPDIVVGDAFAKRQSLVASKQKSPSGCRVVAKTAYSRSSLPDPSATYVGAGIIVWSENSIAYSKKQADGSYAWEFTAAEDDEMVAILDGYVYDGSPADETGGAGGYAKRYTIARLDLANSEAKTREKSGRIVGLSRKLTAADENVRDIAIGDYHYMANATIEAGTKNAKIALSHSLLGSWGEAAKAWAITDDNYDIIVGANFAEGSTKEEKRERMTVYLNLLMTRDGKVRRSVKERQEVRWDIGEEN